MLCGMLRIVGLALAALVMLAAITLALPVRIWRTGEQPLPPLRFEGREAVPAPARRVWIDTDAACGHGARADPDDCLALVLLARRPDLQISGISTVFGNAPRETVDWTVRSLARELAAETGRAIRVHPGAADVRAGASSSPAQTALEAALEEGPLTILALGPLTNVAALLRARPDLRPRIASLVAVMGRRPGHLFHPAEGAPAGSLLGHGPVFRDFNFALDARAATDLLAMGLPLVLVPYDAARRLEITSGDLDRLERAGGAASWAATRSREWAAYWATDIGRDGFFPFDLIAAAFVIEPRNLRCASVIAWVGRDPLLFVPPFRPRALLVGQGERRIDDADAVARAHYCAAATAGLKARLVDALSAARKAG